MYITFAEPEKQKIERCTGKPIIYYKKAYYTVMKAKHNIVQDFSAVLEKIKEITKPIIKAFLSWKEKVMENLPNMMPRDRYRTMKVLSKCGFNEKEINLAVYGLYHCRNNC